LEIKKLKYLMIKKNLVSILIINYNNEKYLDRAIKSCINQTYKNLEILIYDDKSTDGSKFLLNKYSKHKKIKYFINKSKKKIYLQLMQKIVIIN
tara:strand:+ start:246 stop:527 length:282 start_codon:yes stop_codon:yes gene_type:complete